MLEDWFGFLLFDRHKRDLQLTRKGEEYLPAVRIMLNNLHVATRSLLDEDDERILVVSVAESFAVNWLINRLGRFAKQYPGIDVRLASQNQIDDLGNVIGEEGPNWVDLRIRYGRGKWPGLHVTKLFDEEVFPVCSPTLIDPDKSLNELEDLAEYVLIHDDMQMSWESWVRSVGYSKAISTKGPKFSHSHMALQASLNGEGIVLGRSVLTLDYLKSGQLIRPLNISVPAEHSYFLLCQERMIGDAKVKAFTAWLQKEAKIFNEKS